MLPVTLDVGTLVAAQKKPHPIGFHQSFQDDQPTDVGERELVADNMGSIALEMCIQRVQMQFHIIACFPEYVHEWLYLGEATQTSEFH